MQTDRPDHLPHTITLHLLSNDPIITAESYVLVEDVAEFDTRETLREHLLLLRRTTDTFDTLLTSGTVDITNLNGEERNEIYHGEHDPESWQVRAANYVADSPESKPSEECVLEVLIDEGWTIQSIAQKFGLSRTEVEEWIVKVLTGEGWEPCAVARQLGRSTSEVEDWLSRMQSPN